MVARLRIPEPVVCGPYAVAGAAGISLSAAIIAIAKAARLDKDDPKHLQSCNFRHQVGALELLGFEIYDAKGEKIGWRKIPRKFWIPDDRLLKKLEIYNFARANKHPNVLLCHATKYPRDKPDHSFVLDGQNFFDSNSEDKIRRPGNYPPGLNGFHVARWVALRKTT